MLNDKQKRFAEEYMIDSNATAAAKRAGYSAKSAHVIGMENLRKPEIRAFIEKRLDESAMTKLEAIKLISDIAKSNLADYFITTMCEESELIEKPLKRVIQEAEAAIEFEIEFASLANYSPEEKESHLKDIKNRKRELIRMNLELKRNPKATRIEHGLSKIVEKVELDIKRLIEDKERGRIKSIAPTEHGLKVEMYSAEAALNTILKIHGAFLKDNEQKKSETAPPFTNDQVKDIITQLRKDKLKTL